MGKRIPILFFLSGLVFAGGTPRGSAAESDFLPPGAPSLVAESVFVVDLEAARILYAKQIDRKRPVASTQKLLAALIIAESGDLEKRIAVKRTDGQVPPRNLWITEGSSYEKRTLLEMMLVRSFNDVTKCLARDHSGSQGQFAELMNQRAAELGMKNSRFLNVHGLSVDGQYSTARDLMRLAYAAWTHPEINRIVRIRKTTFTYHGAKTIPMENSNDLMRLYPECVGMKTGYTEAAGRCLVAAAERNGDAVLAVLLGSTKEAIWSDSESILRWGLGQSTDSTSP
ncbi:MAG: D-alanyl-D-alanine carboxypeptidase family protein [Verrucomicrobiota bacterium]